MAHPHIRRFHPSAYSPHEAFVRATETPREVRTLAEGVIGWSLGNVAADARSPLGNLPVQFGFRAVAVRSEHRPCYELPLSDHTRLVVASSSLWCASADDTGTVLQTARFEPARLVNVRDVRDELAAVSGARRCATPVDWILGWNHVAAGVRQLAEYEAWAQRRGLGLRQNGERPKAARKTIVAAKDLPAALRALAEWADDSEQAMLTWIVADAKARGVEPELPARYRDGLQFGGPRR